MFHSFSFGELALVFGIVLVLFGGSRLASVGKALGEGISQFKKGLRSDGEGEKPVAPSAVETKNPVQIAAGGALGTSHKEVKSENVVDL